MRCHHFDAGTCRSCTLLNVPHATQIADARTRIEELLAPFVLSPAVWGDPIVSPEVGFRNRAKMVVTGTANEPVLGIQGQGDGLLGTADLADCPLYPPGVEELLAHVRTLIRRAQVPPYDVGRRRGEIRFVHVTIAPDGRMMLRLVLRSEGPLDRIREHLPRLLAAMPAIAVVSANIHPEHAATLEGEHEIHLWGAQALPITMGPVTLRARPRSFLQTNSPVASELYAQVGRWVDELERARREVLAPLRIWDLYCGLGGFAITCAGAETAREVIGVELSEQAVRSAREAAADAGAAVDFRAADATQWAISQARKDPGAPDVVIVNPPRRGIGARLAAWIEGSGAPAVIYSSCHPATLAADLAAMGSYRIDAARLVDMFPHSRHDEVLVRLRRRGA